MNKNELMKEITEARSMDKQQQQRSIDKAQNILIRSISPETNEINTNECYTIVKELYNNTNQVDRIAPTKPEELKEALEKAIKTANFQDSLNFLKQYAPSSKASSSNKTSPS